MSDLSGMRYFSAQELTELEARDYFLQDEELWNEFVATHSDEEVVQASLDGRVVAWRQLPYDWMDVDAETLKSWNIHDYPPEVEAAYRHSRADEAQRERYAKEYSHGQQEAMDKWLAELERVTANN